MNVQTPLEITTGMELAKNVHVIPILRAGLSLVQGILHFVPNAKVGHIGVYRDHQTHKPINYYDNLPEGLDRGTCIVVDPMLATGGSASHAINYLKKTGQMTLFLHVLLLPPRG